MTSSDGQYLNTNVFKYICVFKYVFLDRLENKYLNTVFNYIFEYLNTMYLNTFKLELKIHMILYTTIAS